MSHHVTIEGRATIPPNANESSSAESLELAMLESLKREITAHFETFSTDFRASQTTLRLDSLDVRADEVRAVVSIQGVMNGLPCDERVEQSVSIRSARNKHAAKNARTVGSVATDVAASVALGVVGLPLANAIRMSSLRADQRSRFEKGGASAEEIQFGAEAAALELHQQLCDSLLRRLDAFVARGEAASVSHWKIISLIRWVFALVNLIGAIVAFYLLHRSESIVWALLWGLFVAPIAFFAVHFGGIMAMPADFFKREAAGRAALKFSGVKSTFGVRILAVIGMVMLAGVLALMWYIIVFVRH